MKASYIFLAKFILFFAEEHEEATYSRGTARTWYKGLPEAQKYSKNILYEFLGDLEYYSCSTGDGFTFTLNLNLIKKEFPYQLIKMDNFLKDLEVALKKRVKK